jgi:organic radical activating enzyme
MELTIEITQYCEHDCDYCSSNASRKGKHLDFSIIKDFISRHGDVDRINISGGEPLSHPDFYEILKYCKMFTDNVWIYTNAIDKIIYNTNIVKEIQVEANVCLIPGRDIYLPKNVDKTHLLQLVKQGRAKNMKVGKYHVSRNIIGCGACDKCSHSLLQADGKIVPAPCKKEY